VILPKKGGRIGDEIYFKKHKIILYGGKIPFWVNFFDDICICSYGAFFLRIIPVLYVRKGIG
jgi:hypothetical protein